MERDNVFLREIISFHFARQYVIHCVCKYLESWHPLTWHSCITHQSFLLWPLRSHTRHRLLCNRCWSWSIVNMEGCNLQE